MIRKELQYSKKQILSQMIIIVVLRVIFVRILVNSDISKKDLKNAFCLEGIEFVNFFTMVPNKKGCPIGKTYFSLSSLFLLGIYRQFFSIIIEDKLFFTANYVALHNIIKKDYLDLEKDILNKLLNKAQELKLDTRKLKI